MILGIPKEILDNELRVAALPETVAEYVKMGLEVLVQSSAGEGALRADAEYEKSGAKIVSGPETLFAESDVIVKVKQPWLNKATGQHEVEMMRPGAVLVSFLHPAAPPNHAMIRMLAARNITALTMDDIPRISRAQTMDALTSMSTVSGYKSVLIAANRFPKFVPMIGTAIGPHVEEADIVILSALVPGEVAPVLVTEEMVRKMKPGSVIVDVSIDQGGNCAVTEPGRESVKHGVHVFGLSNIPGSMPVHASWLYAHNMLHYVKNLFKMGLDKPDLDDEIVRHSLVTHHVPGDEPKPA